ncbi:MAG TPA: carboxypeptidase regulatory-like domain-containing protein [Blastocatellia bacterium]|nr:carboxypeptidase regulatory-like domain-containing protein [Blastocatellia bacterium]
MIKRLGLIAVALAILGSLVVISCRRKTIETPPEDEKPAKTAYKSKSDEGTVTGKVLFSGTPPSPKKLDMGLEPSCAAAHPNAVSDDLVVTDGKIANVFVYLKGGPADKFTFPQSPEATLDQNGCRYIPHVMGLQVNQKMKITNSDKATHNIHPTPKSNSEWNESQPAGSDAKEKSFSRKEILIPVKCNIHPWMRAYIGVLEHPFFAVTGTDGSYKIENVPPGDYTIVFWQESKDLGEHSEKITVPAKGTVTKDYTYSAKAAYAPTSLRVEPTLFLP